MISSLTGIINFKKGEHVEILVDNVGYWVEVPDSVRAELTVGDKATLYTDLVVRERLMALYGFSSRADIATFEMLRSVSGVGPRMAIQIFSHNTSEDIKQAIEEANVDFFKKIKGIGSKTAQRLIVDLRSNLDKLRLQEKERQKEKESAVYEALTQLGFSNQEIDLVLPKLDEEADDEEKISQALKQLSGHE